MKSVTPFVLAFVAALFATAPSLAQDYAAIIATPDRADADRQTDQRRDPVKLLAFTGVKTGMTVLDMGAGGGYSTELMARAVGPTGKVYGQDYETGWILDHRRSFGQAGRRHVGRQDLASDRGERAAGRGRGGRLQACRQRRFPA